MRRILVVVLVVSMLGGCSLLRPDRAALRPVESGYLTDYGLLEPSGDPDRAQLVYKNPDVDLRAYDALMFDKVTIWVAHADAVDAVESVDLQRIADDAYAAVRRRLASEVALSDRAGPKTMRLYIGLTHVSDPEASHDVFSTDADPTFSDGAAGSLDPATARFVNEALIEIEIADSETGQVLLAAVDPWSRRFHHERGGLGDWREVHREIAAWAERIGRRLAELRAAAS